MLDFPTDSEDRTSTYDENISKATYYVTSSKATPHSLNRDSKKRSNRFSFRKPNSHTNPEIANEPTIVYVQTNQHPLSFHNNQFVDQPAIPYSSSMAVLQNNNGIDEQPPMYTEKPSFRLSESDELRKLQQVIKRCFILAILSWLCCGGCLYSCLCFLPLYRKNYTFYNVENSFLDDTSSGYGLRKSKSNPFYENDEEMCRGDIEPQDKTPKGEWKYVMKSFKGNRFRDSPYRSVKQKAESAFDCGFCGCVALNCLLLFWVVALGSSTLIVVLLSFFYSGYNKM